MLVQEWGVCVFHGGLAVRTFNFDNKWSCCNSLTQLNTDTSMVDIYSLSSGSQKRKIKVKFTVVAGLVSSKARREVAFPGRPPWLVGGCLHSPKTFSCRCIGLQILFFYKSPRHIRLRANHYKLVLT